MPLSDGRVGLRRQFTPVLLNVVSTSGDYRGAMVGAIRRELWWKSVDLDGPIS